MDRFSVPQTQILRRMYEIYMNIDLMCVKSDIFHWWKSQKTHQIYKWDIDYIHWELSQNPCLELSADGIKQNFHTSDMRHWRFAYVIQKYNPHHTKINTKIFVSLMKIPNKTYLPGWIWVLYHVYHYQSVDLVLTYINQHLVSRYTYINKTSFSNIFILIFLKK